MKWGGWVRKPSVVVTTVVGLDVNSGRIRAVGGSPVEAVTRSIPLADDDLQLPMLVALDGRSPLVGWPAYERVRLLPHVVCRDFLANLGKTKERTESKGALDAGQALAAIAATVRPNLPLGHAAGCVLPGYLTEIQITLFESTMECAGVHIAGSTTAALAIAATQNTRFGTALVLDADEHALTWSVVTADGLNARLLAHHGVAGAGQRAWMDRLIDGIADRCIRVCRRDPRDSAAAEQGIFEQVDDALDRISAESTVHIHVRTAHWYQDLKLTPEDFEAMALPVCRLAIDGMRQVATEAHAVAPIMARPDLVWITADAGRLPGLVAAVTQNVPESTAVRLLPADALAAAGCQLADRWLSGDLARGHFASAIPRWDAAAESPRRTDAGRPRTQHG